MATQEDRFNLLDLPDINGTLNLLSQPVQDIPNLLGQQVQDILNLLGQQVQEHRDKLVAARKEHAGARKNLWEVWDRLDEKKHKIVELKQECADLRQEGADLRRELVRPNPYSRHPAGAFSVVPEWHRDHISKVDPLEEKYKGGLSDLVTKWRTSDVVPTILQPHQWELSKIGDAEPDQVAIEHEEAIVDRDEELHDPGEISDDRSYEEGEIPDEINGQDEDKVDDEQEEDTRYSKKQADLDLHAPQGRGNESTVFGERTTFGKKRRLPQGFETNQYDDAIR